MRRVLLASVLLLGCAETLPEHVSLQPAAENVEIAAEPPSPYSYKLVGSVTGVAAAKELDVAEQTARNDLRNKTATLGGSLVTIDQNLAEPIPLTDKMKVRLVGRAYQPIE